MATLSSSDTWWRMNIASSETLSIFSTDHENKNDDGDDDGAVDCNC
jgi:hypothetical protein